jgi:hypothetical protein
MPIQTKFHFRRKFFALGVCLVFSSILWLLNDLNRPQTVVVHVPVKFTGLPYDMVTTNSLPQTMEATVEATGFDLLWRRYTNEKKIVDIPLRLEKGGVDSGKTYLFNINYYMQDITEALGTHLKIRRIFPDTFSIRFEKKFVKKVPVKLASNLQFEKEFNISGKISVEPDSVLISGTRENISKVDSVLTQTLELTAVNKSYAGKIQLESLNGITYNVSYAQVNFPVEQYTEKIMELPITPTQVPANYELNTIPDIAKVKLLVPLSVFNRISPQQFTLAAQFPETLQSNTRKIVLKMERMPAFIKLMSIQPISVEYKMKAKD